MSKDGVIVSLSKGMWKAKCQQEYALDQDTSGFYSLQYKIVLVNLRVEKV